MESYSFCFSVQYVLGVLLLDMAPAAEMQNDQSQQEVDGAAPAPAPRGAALEPHHLSNKQN